MNIAHWRTLNTEIASIQKAIEKQKNTLKEKKTALKKVQKEVASLEAKKAKADAKAALNRKYSSTLQSLRYLVPAISERRVLPKYRKRKDQCRSRAATEIQSDETVEGSSDRRKLLGRGCVLCRGRI